MTTPFKLNVFFDDEFKNFEYNELEEEYNTLSPAEEFHREMDDLNLVEVVTRPYDEENDDASSEIAAPPTTPCTPTLYEEDEDVEELVTFTDEFLVAIIEDIIRPIPTYAPCCLNTASESLSALSLSSQTPASSGEDRTTTTR
jgi:hypothetical protein